MRQICTCVNIETDHLNANAGLCCRTINSLEITHWQKSPSICGNLPCCPSARQTWVCVKFGGAGRGLRVEGCRVASWMCELMWACFKLSRSELGIRNEIGSNCAGSLGALVSCIQSHAESRTYHLKPHHFLLYSLLPLRTNMNTPWPTEAQDRSYEQSTIPNSIASLLSLEVCTRVSVFAWFFLALVLTWAPRVSSIA